MATVTVGPGKQHAKISPAVAAAASGDTIVIDPGTYVDESAYFSKSLTLRPASGVVKLTTTKACPSGKGIFWGGVANSTTINIIGFDISGAKVSDHNGAAFRYEGGNLNFQNCHIHHCENGILANRDATGTIALTNCEFDHCGYGDGQSHGIYVNQIANLTITDCYFHEQSVGHVIKSRAASTTIRRSRIFTLGGSGSYNVDLPNGGNAIVEDCVLQQAGATQNPFMLTFGVEGQTNAGTSVVLRRNTWVNEKSGASLILNRTSVALGFVDNKVFGATATTLMGGGGAPLAQSGTQYLTAKPTLDTKPIDIGAAPPDQPPVVVDPPPEVEQPPTTETPPVAGSQASVPTWEAFRALEARVAALEAKE